MNIDMRRFAEAADIRSELLKATAGAVERTSILRNRLLVGSYVASLMTPGGIIKPDKRLDEDRYQGKVGLVLKLGPIAFRFDEDPTGELAPKVGEWVLYRPSDSWEVGLGEGAPCRFIFDDNVVAIGVDPKDYY